VEFARWRVESGAMEGFAGLLKLPLLDKPKSSAL